MAKSKQHKFTTSNVEDICFPVKKVKIRLASNDDCAYDIVVYPDGYKSGRRVASCANRYELIENTRVFKYFEDLLTGSNIEYSVTYEMVNYAIFTAKYVLKSKDGESLGFEPQKNDVIYPQIKIRHSYNSQAKYAFMFGYYRMICSNGLVIPVEEMKEYNFEVTGKHTKFFHENFAKLNEKLDTFQKKAKTDFGKNIERLCNNTYVEKWEERVEEVLKATGIATDGLGAAKNPAKEGENVRIISEIALKESAQLDMPVSDWLIYNAINAFLFDEKRNVKSDEVRTGTDHRVVSYMLQTA